MIQKSLFTADGAGDSPSLYLSLLMQGRVWPSCSWAIWQWGTWVRNIFRESHASYEMSISLLREQVPLRFWAAFPSSSPESKQRRSLSRVGISPASLPSRWQLPLWDPQLSSGVRRAQPPDSFRWCMIVLYLMSRPGLSGGLGFPDDPREQDVFPEPLSSPHRCRERLWKATGDIWSCKCFLAEHHKMYFLSRSNYKRP